MAEPRCAPLIDAPLYQHSTLKHRERVESGRRKAIARKRDGRQRAGWRDVCGTVQTVTGLSQVDAVAQIVKLRSPAMSIVVGVPPSHNEKALESGHFGVLRTAASLMPLVLIGIGALATFYLAALMVWGISILLGILYQGIPFT